MRLIKLLLVPLAVLACFRLETRYHRDQPLLKLWGDPHNHQYDDRRHEWVNMNRVWDNWMLGCNPHLLTEIWRPERVPVRAQTVIVFVRFWRRQEDLFRTAVMAGAFLPRLRRRTVIINVEENASSEEQYRVWPHLGTLTVGTVAREEGWDVQLHDELNQGHTQLEEIVQPGDVVGLSIVNPSMDRGVALARRAKELGARYVIAGNDAAIFRAPQLLSLPDRPIDAVFTSNSTNAIRTFFRVIGDGRLEDARHPEIATEPKSAGRHTNESTVLRLEKRERSAHRISVGHDPLDGFVIPDLTLYSDTYWERVWATYRSQFGHKHPYPNVVRNALIHLAQGCTRTRGTDACTYCGIYGIGDIRVPDETYLARLVERYLSFGINTFFNVTDSAFEMASLAHRLRRIGFRADGLVLYGRTQGIARQPRLLDEWQTLTRHRLLINTGMDSADDHLLKLGVRKSSVTGGSRTDENRDAALYIRSSGAHLHCSFIFGSPGETPESCERTLEFAQWLSDTLGSQLDVMEGDVYWLNYGAAVSRIFHDYGYAQRLASLAGRSLERSAWEAEFARYAEALTLPWPDVQESWYRHFTRLDLAQAFDYVHRLKAIMERHPERIAQRDYAFHSAPSSKKG